MSRSYKLNKEAAIQGASASGASINESGAYLGVITEAKAIVSDKGTEGIEISFKADTGAEARFIRLYTHNASGKEIYGFKQVCALMACMKVKSLDPTGGLVDEGDGKAVAKVQGTLYPAIMNIPVGLVLEKEEYTKDNGSIGISMGFYGAFDAADNRMADEIMKGEKATKLDSVVERLRAQAPKQQASQGQKAPSAGQSTASAGAPDDFFDDDIPF